MRNTIKGNQKGITLIALVITIIVLLILAGVSISMLSGENGILRQATKAKENTKSSADEESVKLAVLTAYTKGQGKVDIGKLNEELTKITGTNSTISELPADVIVGGNTYTIEENGTVTNKNSGNTEVTNETTNTTVEETKNETVEENTNVVEPEDTTVAVESITITAPEYIKLNTTDATLTATVSPDNATDKTVTWSSSDPEKAAIDANTGLVTPGSTGPGEVQFTATVGDVSKTVTVNMGTPIYIDGVRFFVGYYTTNLITYEGVTEQAGTPIYLLYNGKYILDPTGLRVTKMAIAIENGQYTTQQ